MKGNQSFIMMRLLLAFAVVTVATSCLDNFDEYNHNPNETTDEELERDNYNVGAKLTLLQNEVIPTEEHLYQFTEILAGDAYGGYAESTSDSWETKFSTFNPSADWLKAPFVDVLTDTYPAYRGIRRVTEDEVPLALADILRVAIMHRLTDQYGPIPYSEMADPNSEALTAIYDTQQEVYTKMFEELDAAIAVLNANTSLSTEAFGDYDQVYAGNISKWILFANSLKLRMAMRLVYADETTARTKAAEAIAGGVIETNADNAKFQPTLNRTAMIWNDWQDHVISADLISYMNGYEDPRRAKMFTTVTVTETVRDETTGQQTTVEKEVFQGLRIGVTPASAADAKAKCSFPIVADTDPFLWMNAAEVAFLKAEYQLRWGTMSEAGALYKKGVELSFEERGAGSAAAYLAAAAKPAAYTDPLGGTYSFAAQSTITPVWSDEDDAETALERIITQKWIVIFPLGNEAWAEYRRTGYPRLAPVPEDCDKSGGTVTLQYGARRIQYPSEEYAENNANVLDAIQKLGGADIAGTRVWWDKKPLN